MVSKVQAMLISVGITLLWLLYQHVCELFPRSMRCVHATLLCCVCYKALHVLEGLRRWCEQVLTYVEPFLRFCGLIVEVPQLFGQLFEGFRWEKTTNDMEDWIDVKRVPVVDATGDTTDNTTDDTKDEDWVDVKRVPVVDATGDTTDEDWVDVIDTLTPSVGIRS